MSTQMKNPSQLRQRPERKPVQRIALDAVIGRFAERRRSRPAAVLMGSRAPSAWEVPRACCVPGCAETFDQAGPWPVGWIGHSGPGARPLYACPVHSAPLITREHGPVSRRYPDEGSVIAGCACGWETAPYPTLGDVEAAYLEHVVPFLRARAGRHDALPR
jgi:hypothetical protein